MFLCGSMYTRILIYANRLLFCQFVFDFPLFVFLGPSHLCVPDIGRFLVACWLKSWTATTYVFLCDPYTYMQRQATRQKVKKETFLKDGETTHLCVGPVPHSYWRALGKKERKQAGSPW